MIENFHSRSRDDTLKIAREFAKTLLPGDIVLLDGDLGAGKTVFVKGIVNELSGGKIEATSPTFVTLNIYNTEPKIYHFDLYRIESDRGLDAIGAEEYFYSEGISLVEWPSRAANYFQDNVIKVTILKQRDDERIISIDKN